MASGADWSREEVEACVTDYLRMLTLELNRQRYSKTEHANALMSRLAAGEAPPARARGPAWPATPGRHRPRPPPRPRVE